eukprot:CAMPEP_0203850096 /NCGR_PEP_ID=MMETSP0359-20131031/6574_1 /ASSEMBLY_ACC=CAM_ASM_000338 /TAXON_ID=268821 /ORGANISM="Scrippsiella Hangoei, Strain SHTV-5" /LENGTH=134 /DNA_ID=CAMNT_0050765943 /DNA_START=31 /DNA_END=435 /DNA_ORIENTATION=-
MARALRILALAAMVVAVCRLLAGLVFVPGPRAAGSPAAAIASATLAAASASAPAWARVVSPGSDSDKRAMIMPVPADEGFTDAEVAGLLLLVGVGFVILIDLLRAWTSYLPTRKTGKGKGYLSPLMKRFIEMGY